MIVHDCNNKTTPACRKCRFPKGGQPKKVIKFILNDIDYEINTSHKLYKLRYSILGRCYHARNGSEFRNYQGKGIKVYQDWIDSPISFYKWAIDSGWKAGLSIDRIDANKDYEPNNCQFITLSENSKKSWRNPGRKLTLDQVAEIKRQLDLGKTCASIARDHKLDRTTISCIKLGKTWS